MPIIIEQYGDECRIGGIDANNGWEGFDAYLEYSFDLENFERILLNPAQIPEVGNEIEPGIVFTQWFIYPYVIQVDKTIHPKCFVRLSVDIP